MLKGYKLLVLNNFSWTLKCDFCICLFSTIIIKQVKTDLGHWSSNLILYNNK